MKFAVYFRERASAWAATTLALQSAGMDTHLAEFRAVFATSVLGYDPAQVGRFMASLGVSRLVGGVLGARLIPKIGPDRFTAMANFASALALCLFASARGSFQIAAAFVMLTLGQQRQTAVSARMYVFGPRLGMGAAEVTAANMNLMGLMRILTSMAYGNLFAWGTSNGRQWPGLPYILAGLLQICAQGTFHNAGPKET